MFSRIVSSPVQSGCLGYCVQNKSDLPKSDEHGGHVEHDGHGERRAARLAERRAAIRDGLIAVRPALIATFTWGLVTGVGDAALQAACST